MLSVIGLKYQAKPMSAALLTKGSKVSSIGQRELGVSWYPEEKVRLSSNMCGQVAFHEHYQGKVVHISVSLGIKNWKTFNNVPTSANNVD
ncbi:hypothetical protein AVEN_98004-1 [Araneus ventricosus]|uniref:Uncharacterized protein n=1 Tax=Araneus ventricosus TaxID=182803 RepID=A0A4Y2N327_ARAVE|nr:hypothetical protein AVEN_98004-1 [Araneus ventricosus]